MSVAPERANISHGVLQDVGNTSSDTPTLEKKSNVDLDASSLSTHSASSQVSIQSRISSSRNFSLEDLKPGDVGIVKATVVDECCRTCGWQPLRQCGSQAPS